LVERDGWSVWRGEEDGRVKGEKTDGKRKRPLGTLESKEIICK